MGAPLPHGTYAPGLATRLILLLSQNTPLGRGKARKMMAAWVRALNGEQLDARLFGQNVRLHMHNNSSEIKALMNPRRYSHEEFAFCAAHMPAVGGVFVDIGANAGLFSLGVLKHMSGGTLIAAEPQPALCERLQDNLETLNVETANRPDIHIYRGAIGAEVGELKLSVPEQLGQASARAIDGARMVPVPVRPLLDILQELELDSVDVVKIDVEGFEDEVILPFIETAPARLWPKAIVLEHCHRDRWGRDCEAALLAAGFNLVQKDRTNLMFERGAD
ncbi:MAG: FkbM family methyltransferase [Hyphomonadaceae bacterium]